MVFYLYCSRRLVVELPSKSRLSLLIIEKIAVKDQQYRPKTKKEPERIGLL